MPMSLENLRKVTAGDLRNGLSEYLNRVQYADEKFLVERNGKNSAVIIPIEEYERLLRLEQEVRNGSVQA